MNKELNLYRIRWEFQHGDAKDKKEFNTLLDKNASR